MNGRARRPAVVHGAKGAAPRNEKVMVKDQKRPNSRTPAMKDSSNPAPQGITSRSQSMRDRKIALQQDVDKLRKKLRHEENVHRALERAFTRPLGALPRLPPYLPSQILELLAEVAVLEEEVVRLEEQVVNARQGLYQEAIIISLAKSAYLPDSESCTPAQLKPSVQMMNSEVSPPACKGSDQDANWSSLKRVTNVKQTPRKPGPSLSQGDRPGKENQSCTTNSCRDSSRLPLNNVPKCSVSSPVEKCAGVQTVSTAKDTVVIDSEKVSTAANKVSEELLTCLLTIFSRMSMSSSGCQDEERAPSPSVSSSCGSSDGACAGDDPYGILEFGRRDIGPYKQFQAVDATSFHQNVSASNTLLGRKLKSLLRKLSSVDQVGLSHQQKLAFWINTYNSCMMNAFLEQGAPTTPHTLAAMMPRVPHLFLLSRCITCGICIASKTRYVKRSLTRVIRRFSSSAGDNKRGWASAERHDDRAFHPKAALQCQACEQPEWSEGRRRRGGARLVWAGVAGANGDVRALLRELVLAGSEGLHGYPCRGGAGGGQEGLLAGRRRRLDAEQAGDPEASALVPPGLCQGRELPHGLGVPAAAQ